MNISKYEGGHFTHGEEGMLLTAVRLLGTGEVRFPPPEFLHDDETAEPVPLAAFGRLYTFTTVHPGKAPPYSLAMVDFEPGLRVFGRLLIDNNAEPSLGCRIRVVPCSLPDGTADFAFEPVEENA